jgi:hypothetical protein
MSEAATPSGVVVTVLTTSHQVAALLTQSVRARHVAEDMVTFTFLDSAALRI